MARRKNFDWEQYINNYSDLANLTTYEKAYAHYMRFGIQENRTDILYYHSVFYKNGFIFVIQPIYKTFDMYFRLFDKSGIEIKLTDQLIKDQWEPLIISMFEYNQPITEVFLKFGPKKVIASVQPPFIQEKKFLGLTTLFKDDYAIFPIFYDYYKRQGVEQFYLYYNGKITDTIRQITNKPDVVLIEWNKVYHSQNAYISPHIAQSGQIHDAIYQYAKGGNVEYLIVCDFDEYLFIPKDEVALTLKEYIEQHPDVDTFAFTQILARTDKRPETMDTFPETILITPDKYEYLNYQQSKEKQPSAKCIHKVETITTVSIHYQDSPNAVVDVCGQFYHFYNWSQPYRQRPGPFETINV